ncbi:hypothetical protein SDC9_05345 [bioreactor metagenome]|uniref:Uncharacterized protein n=1 Tax=bioreactor metagenome TaxID=1076179 RepID=A0A644SYM4_9ZZZZ
MVGHIGAFVGRVHDFPQCPEYGGEVQEPEIPGYADHPETDGVENAGQGHGVDGFPLPRKGHDRCRKKNYQRRVQRHTGAEYRRPGEAEKFLGLERKGEAVLGVHEPIPGCDHGENDEEGSGRQGLQKISLIRFLGAARSYGGVDLLLGRLGLRHLERHDVYGGEDGDSVAPEQPGGGVFEEESRDERSDGETQIMPQVGEGESRPPVFWRGEVGHHGASRRVGNAVEEHAGEDQYRHVLGQGGESAGYVEGPRDYLRDHHDLLAAEPVGQLAADEPRGYIYHRYDEHEPSGFALAHVQPAGEIQGHEREYEYPHRVDHCD